MLIGYARVSTKDQETHLQMDALHKAGVELIYQEKTSGVSARPELQRVLSELTAGDILVVYKMDRVARSLTDLLNILERVAASGAAQLERSIIRERTVAGQVSAIKRGVQFGRPKLLSPEREAELLALVDSGVNQSAASRQFGVSLIVVRRVIDERNGRKNTGLYPVLRKYLDV